MSTPKPFPDPNEEDELVDNLPDEDSADGDAAGNLPRRGGEDVEGTSDDGSTEQTRRDDRSSEEGVEDRPRSGTADRESMESP